MNSIIKIGSRIQKIRKRLRLNQQELGSQLGLSANAISSYETGDATPPIRTLIAIAKLGNCTLEWLIMGTEEEAKLTSEELLLLSLFRQSRDEDRETILRIAEIIAEKKNTTKK